MYKETFVSPFWKDTKEEAEAVLCEIRAHHPDEKGWHEDDSFIEEKNGKFRAVRIHHKD